MVLSYHFLFQIQKSGDKFIFVAWMSGMQCFICHLLLRRIKKHISVVFGTSLLKGKVLCGTGVYDREFCRLPNIPAVQS